MLRAIIIGIGTGYVAKLIQMICGLVLVPFLLSERHMGISEYGVFVSLQALSGAFLVAADGWPLSVAIAIGSQAAKGKVAIRPILIVTLIGSLLLAGAGRLFERQILSISGLESVDSRAYWLMLVFFVISEIQFAIEQLFIVWRTAWVVNLATSLEVAARTLFLLVFFQNETISNFALWSTYVCCGAIKVLCYALHLSRPSVRRKYAARWLPGRVETRMFLDALPLSYKGLANFFVFRGTILFLNRTVGSEAAALMSIFLITLRSYVSQAFVSVLRPMVIPLAAGIKLEELPEAKCVKSRQFFALFQFVTGATLLMATTTSHIWFAAWLGERVSYDSTIALLSMVTIAVEVHGQLTSALLMSQGKGNAIANWSIFCGAWYVWGVVVLTEIHQVTLHSIAMLVAAHQVLLFCVVTSGYGRVALQRLLGSVDFKAQAMFLAAVGLFAIGRRELAMSAEVLAGVVFFIYLGLFNRFVVRVSMFPKVLKSAMGSVR